MFCRVVNKNILPLSFQILRTTTSLSNPFSINLKNIKAYNCNYNALLNVSHTQSRYYAQEATFDDMVVDFQHVKRATSSEKVLIVDVREPEEVKEHGKIPNSINIPLGTVSTVLSSMPDTEFERTFKRPKPTEDTEIIFYCMIGKRSGMAQQNAFNLGFKNVKNYLGSWTDWADKNQAN